MEVIVNKDSIEFSTKTKMMPTNTKTIWEEEKTNQGRRRDDY